MYSIQTKDNNKECDLANLTNLYNSDNIHHYMVDNKSQTLTTDTVKYRNETETHKTSVQKVHFLSSALLRQFLELGKFVRRNVLHRVIQQVTGSFVL